MSVVISSLFFLLLFESSFMYISSAEEKLILFSFNALKSLFHSDVQLWCRTVKETILIDHIMHIVNNYWIIASIRSFCAFMEAFAIAAWMLYDVQAKLHCHPVETNMTTTGDLAQPVL